MKTILMSALIWLALTAVASAATGDVLFIQGDEVNVRQAPDLGAPVTRQFNRGERLFERLREGDWIQVGSEELGDPLGWVHDSLVSRVWPKVALSTGEAAGSEGEMATLMRRLSAQIDELSREVKDLRQEMRELKSDVGHLDDRVSRIR